MALKKTTTNKHNFTNLKVLKDIIDGEKKYKIQIISLEPLDLFLKFLDANSYEYRLLVNFRPLKSGLNIQLEDEDIDVNRLILYNNKRNSKYIQIIFSLTKDEKKLLLKGKKNIDLLLDKYPCKNIDELINIAEGYRLDMPEIMKDSLDYLESIILLSMIRNTKIKDILSNIKHIDQSLDNVFLIRNKIMSLLDRKIITCIKENYKINISHESLKAILERIDFDINRT